MKDENLNKIKFLCNDSGDCASPLGHIFYQRINVENKDYKNYIKGNILSLYVKLPNERGQDMYSELHIETACDDGKMLTELLNFPDIPMKLLSRELPQLRKVRSPSNSNGCSFDITGKDIIKHITKWCKKYGYPFGISQYKNEIANISENTDTIRINLNIYDFLFKIWKLKECVYLFNVYKSDRDNGEYSQFSKNIFDKQKLPYNYYRNNYKEILRETAENIRFSSKLSFNNQNGIFVKVICESPIDAAFYQLFLMNSFLSKPRVRQCKHCGEYFIVKDKRKKYCDKKGCNKGNHYAAEKRRKQINQPKQ